MLFVVLVALTALTACSSYYAAPRRHVSYQSNGPTFWPLQASPLESVFTKDFVGDLASRIEDQIHIPMIPSSVVERVLSSVIEKLAVADVSEANRAKIQEVLAAEGTDSEFDDFGEDELKELAADVANDLNQKIDLPILSEEQEYEVLLQVVNIMLISMTTSKEEASSKAAEQNLAFSKELLQSPESRKALVKRINAEADIPLLGEDQEEEILTRALDVSATTIQDLLPESFVQTLKGENTEGIAQAKALLVDRLNEKVDLIGLDEAQEREFIVKIVDLMLDEMVCGTPAEILFLDKQGQENLLVDQRQKILRQIDFSKRQFEREQLNLLVQLERLDERIGEVSG